MRFGRNVVLAAAALAMFASGCSKSNVVGPSAGGAFNDLAPQDSLPGPSPGDTLPGPSPIPNPTPILPIQFVGWDSTEAGQTGLTHWKVGNDSDQSFTMEWTLRQDEGWPGASWPSLPIHGSITLVARQVRSLDVAIAVPADAFAGMYPLAMTVTRPGNLTTGANGAIRIAGTPPPPPPPPPPAPEPPIAFAGIDSNGVQATATYWHFHNESTAPFTMHWRLESIRHWPGFPTEGDVALDPSASVTLRFPLAVPDTAAAGRNELDMTVNRPDGLPPVLVTGMIPLGF